MKSKFFGVFLGLALSMQSVMGMDRPIDLGLEFTKSSIDADVVVRQVDNDLTVKFDGDVKTISLDSIVTGLLNKLKEQQKENISAELQNQLEEQRKEDTAYVRMFEEFAHWLQMRSSYKRIQNSLYHDLICNPNLPIGYPVSFMLDGYDISNARLLREHGNMMVQFDLSLGNVINMRCYINFVNPLRHSRIDDLQCAWHTVIFNTDYNGKLAIETDYVDIYNAKVKDIVAHSNNDVMVSFDQLFAENIKLLSYFNLAYCTLDHGSKHVLTKIDPESNALSQAFDRSLKVRGSVRDDDYGLKRKGFYCAKDGFIKCKDVRTKGFDEVVLTGKVYVDNWYSDVGIRLGPDLESSLDTDLTSWQNAITINYLNAPWLSVNAYDHQSTTYWDCLANGRLVKIKQLDPFTKKNVIDMPSRPYRVDNDETSASQNQKNIRKILSGEGYYDVISEHLLYFEGNDNFVDFVVALYKPQFTKFLKSIELPYKEVPVQVYQKELQIIRQGINTRDSVHAVTINGEPYFYSPQGWLYDNYCLWTVLKQSIEENGALFKIIKQLLKDLGISINDIVKARIIAKTANDILDKIYHSKWIECDYALLYSQDPQQFDRGVNKFKKMLCEKAGYSLEKLNGMSVDDILGIDISSQDFKTKVIEVLKNEPDVVSKAIDQSLNKTKDAIVRDINEIKAMIEDDDSEFNLWSLLLTSFLSDHGYKVDKISDIDTEDSAFKAAIYEFAKYLFKENIFDEIIFRINQKLDVNLIDLMSSKFGSSEQNQQYDEAQ